jgi:peroxiredoxin
MYVPVYTYADGLPDVLVADGVPATFIIDPQGRIVYKHVGAVEWDNDGSRRFLRSLAAASAP